MAAKKYHIVRALIRFTTALVLLFNSLIPSVSMVGALTGDPSLLNEAINTESTLQPKITPLDISVPKLTRPEPRIGEATELSTKALAQTSSGQYCENGPAGGLYNSVNLNSLTYGGSGWFSDGCGKATHDQGDYIEYTFSGTGFKFEAPTDTNQGIMDVYVDGVFHSSWDAYGSYVDCNEVLYEVSGLDKGLHTVRVENSGSKNPLSSDYYVGITSFEWFGATFEVNITSYAAGGHPATQREIEFTCEKWGQGLGSGIYCTGEYAGLEYSNILNAAYNYDLNIEYSPDFGGEENLYYRTIGTSTGIWSFGGIAVWPTGTRFLENWDIEGIVSVNDDVGVPRLQAGSHRDPDGCNCNFVTSTMELWISTVPFDCDPTLPPPSVVNPLAVLNGCTWREENNSSQANCEETVGYPINTYTGGQYYQQEDFSIPTSGGDLLFQRTYSSLATDLYNSTLGYGWTHSLSSRLILPDAPDGTPGYVSFKAHSANQYKFKVNPDDSYSPMPGVTGTLVQQTNPVRYELTLPTQDKYTFDENGDLLTVEDALGHEWMYTYDLNGHLEKVEDDSGTRFFLLTYDGQGRLTNVEDHTGREVTYGYDAAGDLTSSVDVLGGTWQYQYDTSHHLTEVIDPDGDTHERTEYDAEGRAIRQWDGLDNLIVELTYNTNGTTTVTDALGNAETHKYDTRGTLIEKADAVGEISNTTYDDNFRPSQISNAAGHTLSMTWSEDGTQLLSKMDPEGNQTDYTYDALGNLTSVADPRTYLTTYTYNGTLLTSTTDALNGVTTYTYTPEGFLESTTDPLNRVTSYTYDSYGQRTSMTDPSNKTWTYLYDSLGRLVDTTDPQGRVTHNEYDAAGQLIRVTRNYDPGRPQNDQNVYNIVTEYEYDARGNQTSVTDTYGRVTSYDYDAAGYLVQATDPAGNISTNTYDDAGQLISTTDPLLHTTQYEYDPNGRLINTINALGDSTGATTFDVITNTSTVTDLAGHATTFYYDGLGRVEKVVDALGNFTLTTYDENGNVETRTDQLGRVTTYEYDALNRLIRTTDPNGGVTETFYDAVGNRTATVDPLGNTTTYSYDTAGRLISTTDPLNRITQTEYDTYGRRSATIDAAGRYTTYTYDELDRVITVTDPDNNTTSTTYDALGNVLTRTDANGSVTTMTYDALYQVATTTDPLGNSTTNTYDAGGNLISTTDPLNHSTTYGYDALNRRISTTDPLGNVTQTVYDSLGNVSDTIDANGVITHYEYDELNRQEAVTFNYLAGVQPDASTNVRYEFAYNEVGNRIAVTDANGNTTTYTYDALNRVTGETDPLSNSSSYTYDLAGNRTSATDGKGQTVNYVYDEAGQLTTIDYPGTEPDVTFAYDPTGQRITMTDGLGTTTWTYDDLNRPASITDALGETVAYAYDATGNRTGLTYPDGKSVAYAYDLANQLTEVTDWDSQVTGYAYDNTGQLISVSRPNGISSGYIYDDAGRLIQLGHTIGGNTLSSYVYSYDPVGNLTQAVESLTEFLPPTPIPTATDIATETLTPTPTTTPDLIFADGFESGDLSAWTYNTTDIGDLSVTTEAAGIGNFGLQALIDDTNTIYVKDSSPNSETHYSARFYFDPNSVIIPDGDTFDICIGSNDIGGGFVYRVRVSNLGGLYWMSAEIQDDSSNWISGENIYFIDDWQAVEIEWQAASAPGADDGYLKLWNNDTLVDTVAGIDNDADVLTDAYLGAVNSVDTGTSGAVYFDGFESRRGTYIGLDPNGPSVSPPPPPPDSIFADEFESGDFSAWSSATTDGGDLSVSSSAAYQSNYGMQALINDTIAILLKDDSPTDATHYRARFYFDPNSLVMSDGNEHSIFSGKDNLTSTELFTVRLNYSNGDYRLVTRVKDDGDTYSDGGYHTISDDWHAVEIEWQAASASGADDGYLKLWIDDTLVDTVGNVDNDTRSVRQIKLGATDSLDAGTSGTMYFDHFDSSRNTYIGPLAGMPALAWADSVSRSPGRNSQNAPRVDALLLPPLQETIILTLQPDGAAGLDTYLLSSSATANYGTSSDIGIGEDNGSTNKFARSLLKFDLSSIPSNATVTSATLSLWTSSDKADNDGTVRVYRLKAPFNETQATWNLAATGVSWEAPGAAGTNDRESADIGSVQILANEPLNTEKQVMLSTARIQEFVNGTFTNNGFILVTESELNDRFNYKSSDTSTATQRPKLVVEYTLSPPATETPPPATPTPVPSGPITIDYTYDALNRLTDATYSDGRCFTYTYDPNGNVLEMEQDLGPGTVTTTYTYDIANQLASAQQGGTTWQYVYDANGSLTEVLPGGTPSTGAKRYTYNTAGYLTQVESHNGSDWNTQAEMDYNGLGQRLSMDAAGVIAYYVMDRNRPLTAESNGNTTFYLYGLGAIGEKTSDWSYSLSDGTNTPRQLTDTQGEITLTSRYTPWGDTLDTYGTGNFSFGYLGGVLDATTGLLYVGNGQYYDPSTGRFLTRNGNPNSTNPYAPWGNPASALLAPLAVIGLIYARKQKKSKFDHLIIILFVTAGLGIGLVACGSSNPTTPFVITSPVPPPIPPATNTVLATVEPTSGPKGVVALFCGFNETLTPQPYGATCEDAIRASQPAPHLDLWQEWANRRGYQYRYFDYQGDAGNRKEGQSDRAVNELMQYGNVPIVFIGYSAGGDSAVLAAKKAQARGMIVEAVIIIDPGFLSNSPNNELLYDCTAFNTILQNLASGNIPSMLMVANDNNFLITNTEAGILSVTENSYYNYYGPNEHPTSLNHWWIMQNQEVFEYAWNWVYNTQR